MASELLVLGAVVVGMLGTRDKSGQSPSSGRRAGQRAISRTDDDRDEELRSTVDRSLDSAYLSLLETRWAHAQAGTRSHFREFSPQVSRTAHGSRPAH